MKFQKTISLLLLIVVVFCPLFQLHAQSSEAEDYFVRAEILMKEKKYSEALITYKRAIQVLPNNSKYFFKKGVCLYKMKRADEAVAEIETAIKLDKTNIDAYLFLANYSSKKGDEILAVEYLDQAFIHGKDIASRVGYKKKIIKKLIKIDKFYLAGKHIDEVKALAATDTEILYWDAKYHNQISKDHKAAKDILKKAIQVADSKNDNLKEHIYYELGYAHHHLEEFDHASTAFDKVNHPKYQSKIKEFSPEFLYQAALGYYHVFDYETAEALLKKVISIKPSFLPSHKLLVTIKGAVSSDEDELFDTKMSLASNSSMPMNQKIYTEIIEDQLERVDFQTALDLVAMMEKENMVDVDIRFFKARALHMAGSHEEAIEILKLLKTSKIDINTKSRSVLLLGMIYHQQGKNDEAKAVLNMPMPAAFKAAARTEMLELGNKEVQALHKKATKGKNQ
ncbi:tetratricopeptide repeat protein [Sediminitomix flava]|uniref:Tetratricopeptide repeat protein n=1 Tax=Sediminitomix flava TaxID=379075 RepID=A0A315Z7L5_SEDFL|nr:tetratricopeptide repeat protein [Sediminitomix flava]PWJ40031.1 tetratricopeptide repeat protein [Sediminitomix flava]